MKKYYRHWIERKTHEPIGELGFVFSELDADELIKELNLERLKYCLGYSSKERPVIWHYPIFSHEITKEDYDAKKRYSDPIRQIIYTPLAIK